MCACTRKKYIKDGLDESELGILFDVMTRFLLFLHTFSLVGSIVSLVNHVKTKTISHRQ